MPTIDQLAPATAASDNDELLVSQSGIARKVSRAQVLAGVQPQLAISSGTLLGRASTAQAGPSRSRSAPTSPLPTALCRPARRRSTSHR